MMGASTKATSAARRASRDRPSASAPAEYSSSTAGARKKHELALAHTKPPGTSAHSARGRPASARSSASNASARPRKVTRCGRSTKRGSAAHAASASVAASSAGAAPRRRPTRQSTAKVATTNAVFSSTVARTPPARWTSASTIWNSQARLTSRASG
jgi:hypothetical protein